MKIGQSAAELAIRDWTDDHDVRIDLRDEQADERRAIPAIANPPDNPIHHQVLRDEKGLRPGGFGLLLSRSLVDELIHSEKGNEVILVKYLNAVRPDSSKS